MFLFILNLFQKKPLLKVRNNVFIPYNVRHLEPQTLRRNLKRTSCKIMQENSKADSKIPAKILPRSKKIGKFLKFLFV